MMTKESQTPEFDWEPLGSAHVILDSAQYDQAIQISDAIADPDQQWQVYLNTLALFGLEEWLKERAPELQFRSDRAILPQSSGITGAVTNLQLGQFKVCMVAIGSVVDTVISIPCPILDTPALAPQIYIVIEVLEEESQVQIYGYLRADQLQAHHQTKPLTKKTDQTYSLPFNWFAPDPNALLRDLRCLAPSAVPSFSLTSAPSIQQTLINAAHWFRNQVEPVLEELSWILSPTPVLAPMRSAESKEVKAIIQMLRQAGVEIAPGARQAHLDFEREGVQLRLYTLVWLMGAASPYQGWVLLPILGAQPGHSLPQGVRLAVTDAEKIIDETRSNPSDPYSYVQVAGDLDEQLEIIVEMPGGSRLSQRFEYNPNA
jgi:hypothetical protein